MDWKNKLEAVRDAGQKSLDRKALAALEQYWPQVQTLFAEKVGPAALATAADDSKMQLLFRVVYAALPAPVKVLVQEQSFVQFCFSRRDRLLPPAAPPASAAGPTS
jgi:hypothetical protein